jgi:hypothetical protein
MGYARLPRNTLIRHFAFYDAIVFDLCIVFFSATEGFLLTFMDTKS